MKRLSVFAICLVGLAMMANTPAHGQSVMAGDEMFMEMLKHDIREARTDVITTVMSLSAEDAAVFQCAAGDSSVIAQCDSRGACDRAWRKQGAS